MIDAHGYESVHLAGHDFGGLVSSWTLILHADPPGQLETISGYRTFLRIPTIPGYVSRLGNWMMLNWNLRETSKPNAFPEERMNQFLSAWDNDGAIDSMGAWYRANASFDLDVEKNHDARALRACPR